MVDNVFFIGSRCCMLLYLLYHLGIIVGTPCSAHSKAFFSSPEHKWYVSILYHAGQCRASPFVREWGACQKNTMPPGASVHPLSR